MKRYLLGLLAIALIGCQKQESWYTEGDTFYLKNKDAVMPVWVTGNVESGVFVVTNHGGPGCTSGYDFHKSVHGFQSLEEKYAFVYWDQRMSGTAQGKAKHEDLSVDQHVEDLEQLMTLLRSKYDMKSVFMYGHSWGGGLSIQYLGKDHNQLGINGWIDEDGAIQDAYEMELKREWIIPRAEQQYAETGDEYWLEAIQWWEDNPNPTEAEWTPYEHVGKLGGYCYDVEATAALNPNSVWEEWFFSPYPWGDGMNQYVNTDFMAHYDFMPRAKNISIPTLLIFGKEDGAVPVAVSDTVYNLVATPDQHKHLLQLDECAHAPHAEKPYEFYDAMSAFVEAYK